MYYARVPGEAEHVLSLSVIWWDTNAAQDVYMLLKASVIEMKNQDPALVRSYNRNLSHFLKDMLSIGDRGTVMDLVRWFSLF